MSYLQNIAMVYSVQFTTIVVLLNIHDIFFNDILNLITKKLYYAYYYTFFYESGCKDKKFKYLFEKHGLMISIKLNQLLLLIIIRSKKFILSTKF